MALKKFERDYSTQFLSGIRWPNEVISPFDKKSKVYVCKQGYRCKNTGKYFNLKTDTLMDGSKMSAVEWMLVAKSLANDVNISSYGLSKETEIGQRTCWFMLKRLEPHLKPIGMTFERILKIILTKKPIWRD